MDNGKLVHMANQIARNFAPQGDEAAVAQTTSHIRLFWDPRMKAQILSHQRDGGEGLDAIAMRALAGL